MNLLVNLTSLAPPLTGIGRYTTEILSHLAAMPNRVELRGFNDFRYFEPAALGSLLTGLDKPGRESAVLDGYLAERILPLAKKVFKRVPGVRQLRVGMQNKRLARAFDQRRNDIYWEPNFILGEMDGPSMVTIHDLSHLRYAHFHPADRLRWLEQGMRKTLDRVDRIMTVSNFSKGEIEELYGVDPARLSVVTPGIAACFRRKCSVMELEAVREEYGLPKNYVLSVGTLEPRKNVKGLIEAYSRLSSSLRKQFPLVLAGCRGWQHGETDALIQRLQSRGELLKLGYVPQSQLPQLYQSASVFVYISLYEGFGMPIAEAMASGVPVITSDCASMPEVAAGCARLVTPDDSDSIVEGLSSVLGDLSSASQVCEQARQVSESYCWNRSAQGLLNVASSLQAGIEGSSAHSE